MVCEEMSKRKSVENQKGEKKGKITGFFIPKERTEKGKFTCCSISCRSCNVKLEGLLEITSS